MAHFTKATGVKDWLDQRLAIEKVEKVMGSEYWIPKILTSCGQWVWF